MPAGGGLPYACPLQVKGRLSALDPERQRNPELQDDEALKEATKQVRNPGGGLPVPKGWELE